MSKPRLRPYLSPEFSETTTEQDTAFKAYNELLKTVDPERIASALSAKALNLSSNPSEGLEEKIVETAKEVLNSTNNGTQIGFGKESSSVEEAWKLIHEDPGHHKAASRFNTLKYEPNADPNELKNRCRQRGYATLAAVARIHDAANQKDREEALINQTGTERALAA